MIRTRTGFLVAAGLTSAALAALAACSDSIKEPSPGSGTGGSGTGGTSGTGNTTANGGSGNTGTGNTGNTGGGSSMASVPDSTPCSAQCCPTDGACYSDPTKKQMAPGAACLATRDNTNQKHVAMRQTWINATAPKGNVGGVVYAVLSGRTELPLSAMSGMGLPNCNMNAGVLGYGGYMQLTDLYFANGMNGAMPDYDNDYAFTGFSTFVSTSNVLSDLSNGFCFGTEDWKPDAMNKKYELGPGDMSPQTDFANPPNPWPAGLPPPMPLKDANGNELSWHVAPTKAKRLSADFNLATDRTMLIQKLSSSGDYGKAGYTGVFYYDASTGYQHSYGPLGWVIVYSNDGSTHIAIPARESEFKSTANDPAHPNCIGQYGTVIDPMTGMPTVNTGNMCKNTSNATPPWGGGNCTATTGNATCKPGEGPFSSSLYFLTTELEQIYSSDLMSTLCVSYPTAASLPAGFYDMTNHSCKGSSWNPSKADGSGLPAGDWCAATNSPATATCHDAFRSTNFHTFAGANIKLDSATSQPATCPF